MIERNDLAKFLPSMKSGNDLIAALSVFSEHDDVVCLERLWKQGIALSHERRMTFLYRRK